MKRLAICASALLIGLAACAPAAKPADPPPDPLATATFADQLAPAGAVLTQRGNDSRTGWYATESQLTPASVGGGRFGKRAAFAVDGKVYAQPLFVPGLDIDGGRHDVVFVATEHDTVYAFDAHASSATPPLWQSSLLIPGGRTFQAASDRVARNRLCDSITPEVGITSTPVIDYAAHAIYVMALDIEHGSFTYRLHALNLLTGQDLRPSTVVTATVGGTGMDSANGQVTFQGGEEQQRMGLTLVNGVIYAGFSSWCGWSPYHGWVLGYRAADLARTITYNSTPDQNAGGLWESESGITVDGHGHLLLVTGNGPYNLDSGGTSMGDSLLEMTPGNGTLRVIDEFTPFDQLCRYQHDQDLGSGSPLVVPGHGELILSSKTGAIYVLDQTHLGGYTPLANACKQRGRTDVDRVKQELTVDSVPGGMWGTWGYWKSPAGEFVYGSGADGHPAQWRLDANGRLITTPVARAPEAFDYPGAIPVVSSSGSTGGIVWTVDQTTGAALRAYDATDLGHELWSSTADPARDGLGDAGGFNHFDVPTVADGLVFVGDQSHLEVFGLLEQGR